MAILKSRLLIASLALVALPWLAAARHRAVLHPSIPTFSNEIVRIFQANCQSCHRPGGVAPFSLMSYADALPFAQSIKLMTRLRAMPPWKAAEGCGDFAQQRTLSAREIATIASWVDSGTPEGNRATLPKTLEFNGAWTLGEPDHVLSMSKPFTPPAGRDEYRCFSIPAATGTDQWVSAIDFRPGDTASVHHIIAFLDRQGVSAAMDHDGDGFQCFGGATFDGVELFAAWSPGARPIPLPQGTALSLPSTARVVMQVHYHPHGAAPVPDRTEIALYYAKSPVTKTMHYDLLANTQLAIPSGAVGYHVRHSETVSTAIHLVSVYPHMHLLGQSMTIDALLPDGGTACLIQVPDYDFKWQGAYVFKSPIAIPAGSQIRIDATYDNFTSRTVSWGEGTEDEMCVAIVGYTID